MIDRAWYDNHLKRYREALFGHDVFDICMQMKKLATDVRNSGGKLMIAGNGASAAIASHAAADFTKQGRVPSVTFHDPDLMTMLSNDYGYENWIAKAIDLYHRPGDAVVLVSSSGASPNVVAAAKTAQALRLPLVTFTGFDADNPLRRMGAINFWVDSPAYNVVENTHSIWVTTVIDMLDAEFVSGDSDDV